MLKTTETKISGEQLIFCRKKRRRLLIWRAFLKKLTITRWYSFAFDRIKGEHIDMIYLIKPLHHSGVEQTL